MTSASGSTHRKLPHLGMRTVKTGICVFFCLLLHYLFSPEVALVSSLAAIVSMQSTLESTMKTAMGRAGGTLLGGLAGMAMLPLSMQIDVEGLYVILMPVSMILVIYLCILLKMPGGVSICAYVYITVLVTPMNSGSAHPYISALTRITDTAVGVTIALLVNRFIAPPKLKPPSNVQIQVNPFSSVYDRVRRELPQVEQLVLVDTRLVDPQAVRTKAELHQTGINSQATDTDTVSIPVPTNFKDDPYIHAVYIGPDYSIDPFTLRQRNGYVALPAEAYPVMVGWHVETENGIQTYGLLHHRPAQSGKGHARVLARAGRSVHGPLRAVHPGSDEGQSANNTDQ